jgi:hypothetical protein
MRVADFDWLLMTAADVGLLIVLAIILVRRLHRHFPIFTAYLVYGVIADVVAFAFTKRLPPRTYFELYFTASTLQSLLTFGVLFEIAATVLRPVKGSLPRPVLFGFAVLAVLAGLIAWILSGHASQSALSATFRAFVTVNVINASLAVTCFLAIALTAQLVGITWKNHVLQLASGLAFYSLISLVVQMVQSHLSSTSVSPDQYAFEYHSLDQLRSISYLCAVAFWAWSFAKKEAPRKEFSPQMASFLVSISETAKRNRAALARSGHK